ncbi:MAG: folate-binding protein YgfZ [Acidobacteriales bacterium]|nr:folate-binding protein YgfZ [Terriglobales bacterium]
MPAPLDTQQSNLTVSPNGAPGDLSRQFRAILEGCAIHQPSRAKLKLVGEDRVRWLNGMTTNNVRDLKEDLGVYGFVLNPQGKIQGDGYTFHRGDFLVFDTDADQVSRLRELFDRYIIMDDVEVTDLPLRTLAVIGPKAEQILQAVGLDGSGLSPLEVKDGDWRGASVTLVRTDLPAPTAYEVWAEPQNLDRLSEALTAAGATAVDGEAVELLRIARGVPQYGQDIRERDLPQETEQSRALNFNKGCYIGQEIVERIRSRGAVHRKFTGFMAEGPLPAAGSKVLMDGKEVGEITSAAMVPAAHGAIGVALGYLRREHGEPGTRLQSGETTLTVAKVPFGAIFEE